MKKLNILKSGLTIIAMLVIVAAATGAVFTSQATNHNTFSTGILEVRIDGQTSGPGMDFNNAAPGQNFNGHFTIMNYNAGNFGGTSTLAAKQLKLSNAYTSGNGSLYNSLWITVYRDAGGTPELIYNGWLNGLSNVDALVSYYHSNGLPPGWSENITYTVTLDPNAGNSLQGQTTHFDFVVDASSS